MLQDLVLHEELMRNSKASGVVNQKMKEEIDHKQG
jgi:hypothetical protein